MPKIYVPLVSPEDWVKLLAKGEKHWKRGTSAWETAHSWLTAKGFPLEVEELFISSAVPAFQKVELLLAIPEYKVLLPPHSRHPSQNDLFVLARAADGSLISIMVEGKGSEPFGDKLSKWTKQMTVGKSERFLFLMDKLGFSDPIPLTIRYQLFHRLASAVIEAERFHAQYAMLIVHSFSAQNKGLDDYKMFLDLFGAKGEVSQLTYLADRAGITIYSGWAKGALNKLPGEDAN